jgi:Zn-dependent protease with chaperone function
MEDMAGPDVSVSAHVWPLVALRAHVVDAREWNAAALGNGAVWVYTGLLDEMTDDELAIVLGHELARNFAD